MEKEIAPSEEILQALEEIEILEKEDRSRRRKPKRSSILKLPKSIDVDEADDSQSKRKSFKRRVSFAENFQVLEMNTGNIYDIPGKGGSASESTLNENLSSASKSHTVVTEEKINIIYAAKTKVQVSSKSEMIQIKDEQSHLSKSKKHEIISDEDIEPDKKKLHITAKDDFPVDSESSNVFIDPSDLISKFKAYLLSENCDSNTNKDKDIDVQNTIVNNTGSTLSHKQKSFNLRGVSDEDNLGTLKMNRNELVSKRLHEQQMSKYEAVKSCNIVSSDNQSFDRDLTEVKVLPISLSDIPLEQDKENIYIDYRNKNVFLANALHLKLKDTNSESKTLAKSESESHRLNTEYVLSTSEKALLETENFNPLLSKASESEVKYFREKTCILDHSMDLTCVPSNLDHIENSTEDDPAGQDNMNITDVHGDGTPENHLRDQLDKTCIENSLMDLTHVADNVLDSTENYCDATVQDSQSLKQLKKGNNVNAMEITCHDLDLSCNFLSSTRIDHDALKQDKTSELFDLNDTHEKERCETEKSFQFSQTGEKEACDLKSKAGLFICDISNLSRNSKQGDDENCHSNRVGNCHDEILNSCNLQAFKYLKEENIDTMSSNQNEIVDSHGHEKSLYVSDEMEFTCCEKDLSIVQPQNGLSPVKETTSVCLEEPIFPDCTVADPNTSTKRILYNEKAASSFTDTDDNSKFAVLSKTQHFSSDYMTAKSSLAGDKNNDSPPKFFSKTKRFSSLGMELTCVPSVDNSNKSTRECEVENEKVVSNTTVNSKTQHFASDYMTAESSLAGDKNNDSPQKFFSKTKRFSSLGMELTCIPSVVNSNKSNREIENEKVVSNTTVNSKTQHFASNYMTAESSLAGDKNNDSPQKFFSKTKQFSSQGMELTCIPSVDNSNKSTRECEVENEKIVSNTTVDSKTRHFVFDHTDVSGKSIDEVKKDYSKTTRFSSMAMELTCIPPNVNPMNSTRQHVAEDEKVTEDNDGYSRARPLMSDCLEMTTKSYLFENKKNYDNCTSKIFSGTKCFSSVNMDLTCIPSIDNPMNSTRQHVAEDEKVIADGSHSRAQPLASDYMERIAKLSLVENEKSSVNSPSKSSSKTKHFSSVGMELTCIPDVMNPDSTNQYLSKKENFTEENWVLNECHHPEDRLQLVVKGSAENKDKILHKKTLSSFPNSTDNSLPFVDVTNQKLGLNMDVVEDEMNRTVSHVGALSKINKFSSFDMELTCMPSDNNSIIVRKHKIDDGDSLFNKCYPSKYQKMELVLDSKKKDSVDLTHKKIPIVSNTLLPPDVDLCSKSNMKVQNSIREKDSISKSLSVSKDSFIPDVNSSVDSVFIPEKEISLVDTDFNKIRSTEVKRTLLSTNNPSETQARTDSSNSKVILKNVEEKHFNNEFIFRSQSKSSECHSKEFVNVQNSKVNSRQEIKSQTSNLSDIETSNASNLSYPNTTHTRRKNELPIPKADISDDSHNNSTETLKCNSDIVYAVKQLKDIKQTVAVNPFKFPEAFLSLKKQPKSSRSKIHFSESLRAAIRLSGSLNNSHIMELNKKHSSPSKNKIVRIPNIAATAVTDKMINATPQSDKLNKVQTSCSKTIRKRLIMTCGTSPSEKKPLKKQVIENNSIFSIRKSLETTVRKSLEFNEEVNSNVSSITITHITEENIIKSIASKDENLFLNSSDLENCSVTLVSNTLDSFRSKLNSNIFNESNNIQCKNKTYERLPEQLNSNSMINDHVVVRKSYIDADNQMENDSVFMKQKSVPKVAKINNSTNEELNALSYEPVNTLQPIQDITGKEAFSVEKTNQCLEKKEISEFGLVCKIDTSSKKGDKNSKQTLESVDSFNNLPCEIRMSSNLSPVDQNGCGLKESLEIVNINPNKTLSFYGERCDNVSQMHELSNAHPLKRSFDPSVGANSSSQVYVEKEARNKYNVGIEKPEIIVTETSMQNLSITVDPKETDTIQSHEMNNADFQNLNSLVVQLSTTSSIAETNEEPMEVNRNETSPQINKTFKTNENEKYQVNKTPNSEKCAESTSIKNDYRSCSEETRLPNINNAGTSNINAVYQNIEMNPVTSLPDIAENRLPTTPRPLLQNKAFSYKIDFQKIDDLRRKLIIASRNGSPLWTFIEVNDKKAVFEILDESPWACYYMHVPVEYGSQVSYPAKITFKHSKEDVDEVDELGLLYFLKLVSNYTEISSSGVDKLLENLEKIVECALRAKSLIKDITFIALRYDLSISYSDDIPKLTVEVWNFKQHSLFSLTFPIDFEKYPQEKITPEIKHLRRNEIPKEILRNALEKVEPGTYYLINMVKAVDEL